MKQVPDRKKLRRAYVRRKVALFLLPPVGFVIYSILAWLLIGQHWHPVEFMCAATFLAFLLIWFPIYRAATHGKKIPYVAPVTTSTLPADEILVRGSEEPPVAQSEVLLRAAQGDETPKEELLRARQE
jgi:hypothetical protein